MANYFRSQRFTSLSVLIWFLLIMSHPGLHECGKLGGKTDQDFQDGFDTSPQERKETVLFRKYHDLVQFTKDSSIVKLSTEQFQKYIVETPRNYTVFLLLTDQMSTTTSSVQCKRARKAVQTVADIYLSYESVPALFFVEICSRESPEIFSQIGVHLFDVPTLFAIPSKGMLANMIEINQETYALEEPTSITKWIKLVSGHDIRTSYKKTETNNKGSSTKIGSLFVSFCCLGGYFYFRRQRFWPILQSILQYRPDSSSIAGYLILTVLLLVSGLMYCLIEDVQPFSRNRDTGEFYLIYPSHRNQFMVETYIVCALYLAIVYGMIQLIELPATITDKSSLQTKVSIYFGCFFFPFIIILNLVQYKMGGGFGQYEQ